MPEFVEIPLSQMEFDHVPWEPLYLEALKETPHGPAKVRYISHAATLRDAVKGGRVRYRYIVLENGLDPEEWNA